MHFLQVAFQVTLNSETRKAPLHSVSSMDLSGTSESGIEDQGVYLLAFFWPGLRSHVAPCAFMRGIVAAAGYVDERL